MPASMASVENATIGSFQILGASLDRLRGSPYRAAVDFVRGRYAVKGDLLAAIRACTEGQPDNVASWWGGLLIRLNQSRPLAWLRARRATRDDIRFHYDRSNAFYRQFLDARMVYSCAYFGNPRWSLEEAQLAKLDRICRKLLLRPEDRLLDIGCGWGALLIHAAANYAAGVTGCTLSLEQWSHATQAIRERGLEGTASAIECDYRDMTGRFSKIASVGMVEHVGRSGLGAYFAKVHSLLERDGLFLNHGIVRRSGFAPDGESLFLQRKVFPGTALVTLPDIVDAAERAGFEVLDIENLRPHYALTCRAWVTRLQDRAEECLQLVDEETYRTWLLYLAGSAVNFEDGYMDLCQTLMARRDSRARPLTRPLA